MDKKLDITIHIDKSAEKSYIKVPFEVPENVESMTVSYSHAGDNASSMPKEYEKNVIDLAILDNAGREAGATGSNKKRVTLSAPYSTPGYKRMDIKPGEWNIVCGAYLIVSGGVDVHYTVEFTFKRLRWFRGDPHIHTVSSDGKLTVTEIGEAAKKRGLDYIMITDHNNFFHNKHLPEVEGLTIIPGVEFTHYMGHFNFWGAETPYTKPYAVNSFEEFLEIADEARMAGAVLSVNHPKCSVAPWKWPLEGFAFDAVEVWNGPMRRDNMNAIDWWHNELTKGRKLTAVGGSDYHRTAYVVNLLAWPCTRVLAQSVSAADILEAIKRGRVTVAKSPSSPMLTINSGEAVSGDTVQLDGKTEVTVKAEKLLKGQTLIVYNKQGIIHSFKARKSAPYTVALPVKDKGFVRAEIRYSPGFLEHTMYKLVMKFMTGGAVEKKPEFVYSLTNPIYFD